MLLTLPTPSAPTDLAGDLQASPNLWQMRSRVHHLINRYLAFTELDARLDELPHQFLSPQARPWQRIHWKLIDRNQIIGIDPDIFLAILQGATDTEAPIRDYTQTSRQYLEPIHPLMAELVQDEVNHMTKFWGFGLWLFPESHLRRTAHILRVVTQSQASTSVHRLRHTIDRMMGVLHWQAWPRQHRAELAMTFFSVLCRLHQWSDRLSQAHFNELLGASPIQ